MHGSQRVVVVLVDEVVVLVVNRLQSIVCWLLNPQPISIIVPGG